MSLRDKYNHAIQTAKNFKMDGSAEDRDGKLHFKGKVQSQEQANKIWDAIKTVPSWQTEVVADIKAAATSATPTPTQTQPPTQKQTQVTYTVKSGDTLSKIAREFLGDANAYMEIFNANRDQLTDPNLIKPGQVLTIPQPAHK